MASWTPKDYTPFFLWEEPTHTETEIRREYSRIRDILVKRAKRLYKEGGLANLAIYTYMMRRIPKLKNIKSDQEVALTLVNAWRMLNDPSYSLSGIKKLQDQIFDETGKRVPIGEVLDFHNYMKSWRTGAYRWLVDTNTATRLYETDYKEIGGTFDNFYTIYSSEKYGR